MLEHAWDRVQARRQGSRIRNAPKGHVKDVSILVDQLSVFAALGAVAGLPAVFGVWLGSYAFAPHWAALAFAVGAGAIFQVIVEMGLLLARRARSDGRGVMGATAAGGVAAGVLLMYATALLVQV